MISKKLLIFLSSWIIENTEFNQKIEDPKFFKLTENEMSDKACFSSENCRVKAYYVKDSGIFYIDKMQPEKDIEIRITGLRPGEKLHEELLHESEELLPTRSAGILLAAPRTSDISTLRGALDTLETAARNRQREEAMQILCTIVPEYSGPATTSAAIV